MSPARPAVPRQAKNVRVVPEASRSGENSPSHRVYVGRVDYAE
jgi:uncharacterized protein (DUF736 family)